MCIIYYITYLIYKVLEVVTSAVLSLRFVPGAVLCLLYSSNFGHFSKLELYIFLGSYKT